MMPAYRPLDGLEKTISLLASVDHEIRSDLFRRRVQTFLLGFFGLIFVFLLGSEVWFAVMMFSILQIEILGTVFSGATFAMLVPTVIAAAHVKLHHEADHFTNWWLKRLSSIGILIFALGISLMVGFSAWQAAQDAVNVMSAGSMGAIGGHQIGAQSEQSSGIAGWIAVVPNSLLFLGLSFGLIITIYFASFCLGRALQAFNILTRTPKAGPEVEALTERLKARIAALRRLLDEDAHARRKLPFDVKTKFAREASHACWRVSQMKLAAARRKFDPMRVNDPLSATFVDGEVAAIPNQFETEKSFTRHLADQTDATRLHNILCILNGIPETDGESS